MTFPRKYFSEEDIAAYRDRSQNGPCFVCATVGGDPRYKHHVVYEDESVIAFLNMSQQLYAYTLVCPKEHRKQALSDFTLDEYLSFQRVVYQIGEAIKRAVPTERLYILSIGSQQANRHVHWHLAPLPPGVPYEQQQLAGLRLENGALDMSGPEMAELARRIAAEIKGLP